MYSRCMVPNVVMNKSVLILPVNRLMSVQEISMKTHLTRSSRVNPGPKCFVSQQQKVILRISY